MQRWDPNAEVATNRCTNCGGHVSENFRRTHSDENGRVHACPDCCEYRDMARLAAGLPALENFGGAVQ